MAQMKSQLTAPHLSLHLYCKLFLDYLTAISDLSDALARGLGIAITEKYFGCTDIHIRVLIVIPVLKRLID